MAQGVPLSNLPERASAPADDFLFYLVDVDEPVAADQSKRIKASNLFAGVNASIATVATDVTQAIADAAAAQATADQAVLDAADAATLAEALQADALQAILGATEALVPVGDWISGERGTTAGQTSSGTTDANTIRAYPVAFGVDITTDRVSWSTGTAVSGNARVGIYDSDALGRPNTLLWSGTVSMNATTAREIAVSPSITLQKGKIYWLAFQPSANVSAHQVAMATTANLGLTSSGGSTGAHPFRCLVKSRTYANAMEATWTWSAAERSAFSGVSIRLRIA